MGFDFRRMVLSEGKQTKRSSIVSRKMMSREKGQGQNGGQGGRNGQDFGDDLALVLVWGTSQRDEAGRIS